MTQFLPAISTGLTAFTATNLDDVVILLLFFSQVNHILKHKHIVVGQYLGFSALVLTSLPSFFGSVLLPRPWIGMLGILPIAIGINRFLNSDSDDENADLEMQSEKPWFTSFLSPQTYSVAAVTFANGGDNVGIYVPLFANCTLEGLIAILGVFFLLVGVWCYTAFRLTQVPAIANTLTRYGNQLVPFVLIGLGILILNDSGTLENRGLAVLSLVISGCCLISAYRNATVAIEVVSSISED
ncbi:cadmium resistance transporter [Microcoleus sp. FACHB-1515]|uniref:cadmium resistance transporter n=1 Tax=Cyanophyceae TaxID=3028117 RepID=UPI001684D5D8|nr:cadmium resistance transporter [Microcoleus sp. FACHB-1515]MBD2092954.1 cadmium resistance transporter [Microcoleus sp. FACHB-1515]